MTDEKKYPQRPEGMDGQERREVSVPRIEVEPTAGAGSSNRPDGAPQVPASDEVRNVYAGGRTPAPYAAAGNGSTEQPGTRDAGAAETARMPRAEAPSDAAAPRPSHAAPAATAVEKHTVVKTKAKKLPVFFGSLAGVVVGAVLVLALAMSGAFSLDRGTATVSDGGSANATTIDIDPEDTTLAEVVASKALPSVVSISTETAEGGGIGSGVVYDTDGNIITNYHVVEGATGISVNIGENSYEATVVGTDESSDLAVIKVDAPASELTPVEIADSDELTVGEWVMAIGSPFGNEQSVSTGIVSALYRSTAMQSTTGTTIYANMIQTDAAINPGNSGGALVNDEGQLIGINSIIESYSGSSSGVGFAIPSNYAVNIADQIIEGKTPVHAYLGATLSSVNALTARQNNLGVTSGAYVVSVTDGSPAAEAGLQQGDVITKVDDDAVDSADSLIILVREHKVGDKVTLTVNRNGTDETLDVTLGSDEALQAEQQDTSQDSGIGNGMSEEDFYNYQENQLGRSGRQG